MRMLNRWCPVDFISCVGMGIKYFCVSAESCFVSEGNPGSLFPAEGYKQTGHTFWGVCPAMMIVLNGYYYTPMMNLASNRTTGIVTKNIPMKSMMTPDLIILVMGTYPLA